MTIMEEELCKKCGRRLTVLDGEELCRKCETEQQIKYLSIGYTIAMIGVAIIGFLAAK
jgi:predicted amidophosphoribosyltransferase